MIESCRAVRIAGASINSTGENLENHALAFPVPGRPAGFSTKPGAKWSLTVYKRYEPHGRAALPRGDHSSLTMLEEIDQSQNGSIRLEEEEG